MAMGTETRDAVIVGGGHNGLVCAWYLASAALKVTVCEARPVVGGAAVTEEFHPGFRNSVAAYTVSPPFQTGAIPGGLGVFHALGTGEKSEAITAHRDSAVPGKPANTILY